MSYLQWLEPGTCFFLDISQPRERAETTSLRGGKTTSLLVAQQMPGSHFIAFRVPLKKNFEENFGPEKNFFPLDLLKENTRTE